MDILFTDKTLLFAQICLEIGEEGPSLEPGTIHQRELTPLLWSQPPPLLLAGYQCVVTHAAVCRPDPPMPQNLSAGQKSFLYDELLTAITSDNAANRAFHPKSLQDRSFSLLPCLLHVLFCLFLRRSEIWEAIERLWAVADSQVAAVRAMCEAERAERVSTGRAGDWRNRLVRVTGEMPIPWPRVPRKPTLRFETQKSKVNLSHPSCLMMLMLRYILQRRVSWSWI